MKTKITTFLLSFTFIFGAFGFTACEKETNPPSDIWKSYFVFENVTVKITETETSTNPDDDAKTEEIGVIKIVEKSWERVSLFAFEDKDGVYYPAPVTQYYDGIQGYINGTPNKNVTEIIPDISMIESWDNNESSFKESSTGVFFSKNIDGLEDVTITVTDKKIQSISYPTFSTISEGVTYITIQTFTFIDWGTTAIEK